MFVLWTVNTILFPVLAMFLHDLEFFRGVFVLFEIVLSLHDSASRVLPGFLVNRNFYKMGTIHNDYTSPTDDFTTATINNWSLKE